MDRSRLVHALAVFPDDGSSSVLLDRMVVTFSARRCVATTKLTHAALHSTLDLGLDYDAPLRHQFTRRAWIIRWRWEGVHFEYRIPKRKSRGMYTIRLRIVFNPLRMLRARASRRERRLHSAAPDAKDNVLDPRAVPPEVAHRRVTELVPSVVRPRLRDFIEVTLRVLGAEVAEHDVYVTASQIELPWDRACDAAHTAIHAFSPAWCATIPRARKRYGIGRKERSPYVELWGAGILKAAFRQGWVLKLYPVPGGILRYECQLTKKVVRAILGRPLCLLDAEGLRRDLVELARRVYGPIVDVQRSLEPARVPSVETLFTAFVPRASAPLARLIAGQLIAFGQVECNRSTPSVYKVMRRMRTDGLMEKSTAPGFWVPTPSFALTLQAGIRQCLILMGRKARTPRK